MRGKILLRPTVYIYVYLEEYILLIHNLLYRWLIVFHSVKTAALPKKKTQAAVACYIFYARPDNDVDVRGAMGITRVERLKRAFASDLHKVKSPSSSSESTRLHRFLKRIID